MTIHNLTKNAFLFYIPSPTLRRRVLQHELWRVGDSPFFVTEWKAAYSLNPPSLDTAPIWAKIESIPFDLVTEEGLSYIARPLGQVVDAKPFSSINSAKIKVIVDLTKPLPKELEIERDDGSICIITVSYPWLPPLCPICNNIGHKAAFCPQGVSVKVSPPTGPNIDKGKSKVVEPPLRAASNLPVGKIYVPKHSVAHGVAEGPSLHQKVTGESAKAVEVSTPLVSAQDGAIKSIESMAPKGSSCVGEVSAISETWSIAEDLGPGTVSVAELVPRVSGTEAVGQSSGRVEAESAQIEASGQGAIISVFSGVASDSVVSMGDGHSQAEETPFVKASRTVPNRAVVSSSSLVLITSNPFDALNGRQEEDDQQLVVGKDLQVVLYSPSNSSSSGNKHSKKKRKVGGKNSPIHGGGLSLATG